MGLRWLGIFEYIEKEIGWCLWVYDNFCVLFGKLFVSNNDLKL